MSAAVDSIPPSSPPPPLAPHKKILLRLREVYHALKNYPVVTERSVHGPHVKEFENLLNNALPQDDNERLVHQFISELYRRARKQKNTDQSFWRFISDSGNNSLVLWSTNSGAINRALKCSHIQIKWSATDGKYVCEPRLPKSKLRSAEPETQVEPEPEPEPEAELEPIAEGEAVGEAEIEHAIQVFIRETEEQRPPLPSLDEHGVDSTPGLSWDEM